MKVDTWRYVTMLKTLINSQRLLSTTIAFSSIAIEIYSKSYIPIKIVTIAFSRFLPYYVWRFTWSYEKKSQLIQKQSTRDLIIHYNIFRVRFLNRLERQYKLSFDKDCLWNVLLSVYILIRAHACWILLYKQFMKHWIDWWHLKNFTFANIWSIIV